MSLQQQPPGSVFQNDQEELAYYRKLFHSMNCGIYVLNQNPYRVDWISENDCVERVTGLTSAQVMEKADYIYGWLLENPDFAESVTIPVEKFIKNPDIKWAGLYRIKNEQGKISWVMYSAATMERSPEGIPIKVTVAGFPIEDIFNTPRTLIDFQKYLSQKIYQKEISDLTDRQLNTLISIAKGASRQEIADELKISLYTVDDHKTALYKKLGCKSTSELAAVAQKYGLV